MRSSLLIASAMAMTLAAPAFSAKAKDAPAAAPAAPAKPAAPHYGKWGVDLTAADDKISPGDDFDAHVNGAWSARTVIPADQASTSSFYDIYNLTLEQKKYVIASQGPETPIGGLYKSFMDEAAVEKVGDKPLRADLARIAAIPDRSAFARYMGETAGGFGRAIVDLSVDTDTADPTTNVLWFSQGGIGLPDRDYYLKDDFKTQRDAYVAYIARQLGLAGYPNPTKAAADIMAFETEIAKVSWAVADRREIEKINNPMTLAQLKTYAPGVDWDAFFAGAGISAPGRMIVQENTAIKAIADLYARTPLETLKAWEAFGVTAGASPYLPKRYVDSRFQFTSTLNGAKQLAPRWKRADTLLDNSLGELMGQVFVADFFPAASKAKMEDLVANLKVAMAKRIAGNDWMAPATKMAALEKLAKMDVMVGYPYKFRDYSALKIDVGDLYGNVARSHAVDWQYSLSKLYKPVDRKLWGMNPQEVNAYNGGLENKIVFPAGILQAPAFDPDADAAVNYGAIGAVIGHEISHGFDDQGSQFDANGNLRDWWTKDDHQKFAAKTAALVAQYDAFEAVPGYHVNGKLTLGENIADNSGLAIAYKAWKLSLGGKPAPAIDGFTGEQRFFLAFAQSWRGKTRDNALIEQLKSDPHSPDDARGTLPVRNQPVFYDAFGVKAGDAMYLPPEKRVQIW